MATNMTVTSSDGRVDIIPAPDGFQTENSNGQNFQQGQGHPDQIEDVVSIGVALTTAEKLKEAKDEVELLKILGVDEEKARELTGQQEVNELPGEKLGKEAYMFDAVREVVIDLLSSTLGNEDEVAIFRTVEARLADKLREKESDPWNRDSNKVSGVEGEESGQ